MTQLRVLGMTTLAEGVETERQLQALRALGCNAAQGYLFGKPVPAQEAALMLTRVAEAAQGSKLAKVVWP